MLRTIENKDIQGKSIEDLKKEGKYIHRYKWIVFNNSGTPSTPQRRSEFPDKFDFIFNSKEEFENWNKSVSAGLAKLDECLNYCEHFVREKGNVGAYERDGKRYYPVDGTWCGLHDFSEGESGKFFTWVVSNFGTNWYKLRKKYEQYI